MSLDWPAAVGVDCGAWALWGLSTGWSARRLGSKQLGRDTWLTRPRSWERGGRFYRRWLRVGRWQRFLPEAGAVWFGGVDKRHLGGRSTPALQSYAEETRRAEYVHWLGLTAGPVFMIWNPAGLAAVMIAYAIVANGPCLVSLRANRLRILVLLSRRQTGRRL